MKDARRLTVYIPSPLLAGIERARRDVKGGDRPHDASEVVRHALVVYLDDLGHIDMSKIKPEALQDGRGRWKRKK